jgi:hypothetical protein
MTTRTRYFVITSLLILTVGVGTGLVAYYVGLSGAASAVPEELRFVPRTAAVVAFVDVRDIMSSDLRQRVRKALPVPENGQREFQDQTGVDIESDVDFVVASLQPTPDGETAGLVVARGEFSEVKIDALMRERGAAVEEYNGRRILERATALRPGGGDSFALSFLEPGLIAVGSAQMVRAAIDLQKSGENVTGNTELMELVRSLDSENAWVVGRLDVFRSEGRLPPQIAARLPAITWFSVTGHVDSGIRGVVRADGRDEEAANSLRDVVRGFLALAKLQSDTRPELQAAFQSLQLGGTGRTVTLSFSIPAEAFDTLQESR